jgi:hypothetical protein
VRVEFSGKFRCVPQHETSVAILTPHRCGCSSVGRASASQAECRGFDSLRPLCLPPMSQDDTGGFSLTNSADSESSGEVGGSVRIEAEARTMTGNDLGGRSLVQAQVQAGVQGVAGMRLPIGGRQVVRTVRGFRASERRSKDGDRQSNVSVRGRDDGDRGRRDRGLCRCACDRGGNVGGLLNLDRCPCRTSVVSGLRPLSTSRQGGVASTRTLAERRSGWLDAGTPPAPSRDSPSSHCAIFVRIPDKVG